MMLYLEACGSYIIASTHKLIQFMHKMIFYNVWSMRLSWYTQNCYSVKVHFEGKIFIQTSIHYVRDSDSHCYKFLNCILGMAYLVNFSSLFLEEKPSKRR